MLLDPLPMGGHKVMHAAQQDCEPIPGTSDTLTAHSGSRLQNAGRECTL